MDEVQLKDIEAARERIRSSVKLTPIITCTEVNRRTGKEVFFKCEHLQRMGAYKIRGALNAALKIKESNREGHPGLVADSSGNFGMALALAASLTELPCTIVVPNGTPVCKKEPVRSCGSELVEYDPACDDRFDVVRRVCKETGKVHFDCCDDRDAIAGQGTIGLELLEQIPELDAVFLPVSGGSLSSGVAVAIKAIKPACKIYLVIVEANVTLEDSLRTGEKLWSNPPAEMDTIADGLRLPDLGGIPFDILQKLAEKDVFRVSDAEIIGAMKFSFHRMKQVIEPSAACTLAGIFSEKMSIVPPEVKRVAVVISGGNTDIDNLPWSRERHVIYLGHVSQPNSME